MLRKIIGFLLLAASGACAHSQTGAIQGHSFLGGTQAITSGSRSSNYLDGIIPHATITVYLTGTTTLATIYSNASSTPLSNPFTSNNVGSLNPGGWIFWAATGQGYDIVASGGIAPNTYPNPVTLCADCFPSSQFTVVAGVTSAEGVAPIQVNGDSGTPHTGALTVSCPNGCSSLLAQYQEQGTGNYALIYPQTCAATGVGSGCGSNNQSGGYVGPNGVSNGNLDFTNWQLPVGVTPGDVTSAYISVIGTASIGASGQPIVTQFNVSNNGGGTVGCSGPTYFQRNGPTAQVSCPFSAIPTSFSAIDVTFSAGGSGASIGGFYDISQVVIEIHYVGAPSPTNNSLLIQSPLFYNPTLNALGIGFGWPDLTFTHTVSTLPTPSGVNIGAIFDVTDGSTSTDCSTGGGSNFVLCKSTGAAYTGIAIGGSSGITQLTGDVTAGPGSGSQAATLATVNGAPGPCGDSTHVCQVTTNGKGLTTTQTAVAISGVGAGVSSLNTLTGALALTSTGSTVTITPSGSNIDLEATGSSSGVQYSPPTTAFIITSFSGLYDDNHVLSSPVAVTSYTCTGGTCTVNTSASHNLKPTVGNIENNYVDVTAMTGFGATDQSTGIGSFPVASIPTSTQFTFASTSTATCSSSCGSIYDASYWALYQTANQPFLKNSGGTVDGVFSTLTNLNTNFSSLINCTLGTPTYLIIESGQNDIAGGATAPTLEALYQSVWTKAHSAGCIVIQGSLTPANYGGFPPSTMPQAYAVFNVWVTQQAKSFALQSSGNYWDRFIDYNAALAWRTVGTLGNDPQSARIFAQRTNEAFSNQSDSNSGPPPLFFQGTAGDNVSATTQSSWYFFDNLSSSPWMSWGAGGNGGSFLGVTNLFPSGSAELELSNSATGLYCHAFFGFDSSILPPGYGNGNGGTLCFNYVSANNAGNYAALGLSGLSPVIKYFQTGVLQFPNIVASSGLAALCVDTSGNVQTGACGGGVLDANTINTPQYASGGGTANAQTVTLSPSIASLSSGMHVRWKPSVSNTGPMTLAVNSISPVNVTKCGTTALVSGDVSSGIIADGTYDGTEIQLTNPQAVACAGGSPGVTSIDTLAGAFTFGGAVSHVGNAYTFGGGSIDVNGSSVSSPNFNAATPAAPGGNTNCTWQVSGSSVSCYVPTSGGGGALPTLSSFVFVNAAGGSCGSTTCTSPSFTPPANSLVVVSCRFNGSNSVSSVSDSASNAYTVPSGAQPGSLLGGSYFYYSSSPGAVTVSCTYGTSSGNTGIIAMVFQGLGSGTLDGAGNSPNSWTSAYTSSARTLNVACGSNATGIFASPAVQGLPATAVAMDNGNASGGTTAAMACFTSVSTAATPYAQSSTILYNINAATSAFAMSFDY